MATRQPSSNTLASPSAVSALEDDITWVTRKALKACGMAPAQAAARAGLDSRAVLAFSRGIVTPEIALALAPVLDLHPQAFARLPTYQPEATLPPGVDLLEFPFGDGSVNAWLIRAGDHAVLIDAGPDHGSCARRLDLARVSAVDCFVTHGHRDHIGGLGGLGRRAKRLFVPAAVPMPEAVRLTDDSTVRCGPIEIVTIDLAGHCPGALGYLIRGLTAPLCAVGDAVFAGSVGGTPDPRSHRLALDRIRRHVLSLPPDTILLPGHGPATTVGQELRHNPFLART